MASTYAQDKFTISGYIKDASNGETLIGATLYIPELNLGASSNEYGFYSISIPPGTYQLEYAYLGFENFTKSITLSENITENIELSESVAQLTEVVVSSKSESQNVTNLEMSVNQLDINTIKRMPTLLGEVDVVRSIQLLPGVSTVGEGASGFNVRGGSIDQNLVLLDEAPVL